MRVRGGHAALLLAALLACGPTERSPVTSTDATAAAREAMVAEQIERRGVRDPEVLRAMRVVPRHEFVPVSERAEAYDDHPLPIGHGQTISQPYIVAFMTEAAAVRPGARVLEIGTGSGYQAAVLAEVGAEVYTIEIVPELAAAARAALTRTGYERVHTRTGDGHKGWPEAAPFEAIIVTAAAPRVPPALLEQLAVGGRLVMPVGSVWQEIEIHHRTQDGISVERVLPVRFVPLVGGP
ncbi:MAG TPA: protein-L-isoaspartate(D-aspartate) O-methyltransferase [Candidatus Limnocylindria bacterium]|nr:protein-L-isoaspartate(D-aspartate) O-methyltransferase [Candidatus Limnocylindria bacterium]